MTTKRSATVQATAQLPSATPGQPPQQLQVAATQAFTSPFPPPELLRGYDEVNSGLSERIVNLIEGQSAHRQRMEVTLTESQIRLASRGQWLAFTLALSGLVVAGYMTQLGHATTAAVIGSLDLVALVSAFLGATRQRH